MVVELVGPAGAGKSSVARALRHGGSGQASALRPRRVHHALSIVALLPTWISLRQSSDGFVWRDVKRFAYLRSFERCLAMASHQGANPLVMDEGPVYMLGRMLVYRTREAPAPAFERSWQASLARWSRWLDLIVSLDAADTALIERLRTRRQPHRMGRLPEDVVIRFLASYRAAYRGVLETMQAAGVRVVSLRTDEMPMDVLVGRVSATIFSAQRASG